MKVEGIFRKYFVLSAFLLISIGVGYSQGVNTVSDYQKSAQVILQTYRENAFLLSPAKSGHMGLRLYKNYKSREYRYQLLQGAIASAHRLDKIANAGFELDSLQEYALQLNAKYKGSTTKKRLRKACLEKYPMYNLIANKVLRNVLRLQELGLYHSEHDHFVALLQSYDFKSVFTDSDMIRAWGAQLANQVYWLYQLDLGDYREDFRKSVNEVYPAAMDDSLSKQQFENKIYTLTHIIIAASAYYSHTLDYSEYSDIVDYFRVEVNTIIDRCKEDVIIETGLSLLLVDDAFPEIAQIRDHIVSKIDPEAEMILSVSGSDDIPLGEHRNIIAVLLLDWQGCSALPGKNEILRLKKYFPQCIIY